MGKKYVEFFLILGRSRSQIRSRSRSCHLHRRFRGAGAGTRAAQKSNVSATLVYPSIFLCLATYGCCHPCFYLFKGVFNNSFFRHCFRCSFCSQPLDSTSVCDGPDNKVHLSRSIPIFQRKGYINL